MSFTSSQDPDEALSETLQHIISSLPDKTLSEEEVNKRAQEIAKQLDKTEEPLPPVDPNQVHELLSNQEQAISKLLDSNKQTIGAQEQIAKEYKESLEKFPDQLRQAISNYPQQLEKTWQELRDPLQKTVFQTQTTVSEMQKAVSEVEQAAFHTQNVLNQLDSSIRGVVTDQQNLNNQLRPIVQTAIDGLVQKGNSVAISASNASIQAADSLWH